MSIFKLWTGSFARAILFYLFLTFQNTGIYSQSIISSFSPTSTWLYSPVTITCTNASQVTAVSFGNVPALFFYASSASTVYAVVNNGANGYVKIKTNSNTDSLAGFTFLPAPVVSSFNPISGLIGTSVLIKGKYFSGATSVYFGNSIAQSFVVNSDSVVTAIVGAGSSGNVGVATPAGFGSLLGFTHFGPSLTSYSPAGGPAGTVVSLKGKNLSAVTSITFQGIPAASFNVLSDSTINATTGAGAFGTIKATSPSGSATLQGFNLPVVASFSPLTGSYNTRDTIRGKNFNGTASVKFGEVSALSFIVLSDSLIVANVGAGASGRVKISNSFGSGESEIFFNFTVQIPEINSFSPSSGYNGSVITIKGKHLAASNVLFGSNSAKSVTLLSDTSLTAEVGDGNTGKIIIYNQAGQATSVDSFFYTGPAITSFTPVAGSEGDTITISGQNFIGVTGVSFGNVPATSYTTVSPEIIKARVGNGNSGNVTVNSIRGSVSKYGFYMMPKIDSFYPSRGGAGTTVYIRGKFFNSTYSVNINGYAVSFDVRSDTVIAIIIPAYGNGNITVVSLGGIVTSNEMFAYIPKPEISGFTPTVGGVDTVLKIFGYRLQWVTRVTVGGVPVASFKIIGDDLIEASIGNVASGSIAVYSDGGEYSYGGFLYYNKPNIKSFTPSKGGPMDIIDIRGTDLLGLKTNGDRFDGYQITRIGGIDILRYANFTDSVVSVYLTEQASGTVYVETPGGRDSISGFVYQPVPVISALSPVSASAGDTVTITGKNFSNLAQSNLVHFGAITASVISSSLSSIKAIVPAGVTFEPVSVTMDTKTGYSKRPFIVTFPGADSFSARSYSTKIDMRLGYKAVTLLGDINGDGKLDLVAGDREHAKIYVYLNNSIPGIISFQSPVASQVISGAKLQAIKDVDGDGKLDILFTEASISDYFGYLWVLKNTSTIFNTSFKLIDHSGVEEGIVNLSLGDLNRDGRPDIIFPSAFGTRLGLEWINIALNKTLQGQDSANFRREEPVTVGYGSNNNETGIVSSTLIADFDQDGKPDILAGITEPYYTQGHYFTLLQNNFFSVGDPYKSFNSIRMDFPNEKTSNPQTGYLNADSLPDIICDTVALINNGNFNFSRQTNTCVDCNFIDDMDGDGIADLGKLQSDSFYIVRNKSNNDNVVLTAKIGFYAGAKASNYTIGDIDGDGRPEIVVERYDDSTVSFLGGGAGGSLLLCSGASTSLLSNLIGSNYQWQVDRGNGFVNISNNTIYSGSTSVSLQLNNLPDSLHGFRYRCAVGTKYSYAYVIKFQNIWTGTLNNAWENPANWSCSKIPSAGTDVVINYGSPTISSNVIVGSLQIKPGASVTVSTGYTLNVIR